MGNCTSVTTTELPRIKYESLTPDVQETVVRDLVNMIKANNAHTDPVGFRIPATSMLTTGAVCNVLPLMKAMQVLEVSRPYTLIQSCNKVTVAYVQNLNPKNFVTV